jgi:CHASE2 domain-containing sensor protein
MKDILTPPETAPASATSTDAAVTSAPAPAIAVPVASSADTQALRDQLIKIIGDAEVGLDTDAILAASMKKAGNVVIPSFYTLGEPLGKPDNQLPAFALKNSVDDQTSFSIPAIKGQQPIDGIGSAVAGVAHLNQLPDSDGAVRREPLLVDYYGKAIPSMSLLVAAKSLNLDASDIRINPGKSVQVGKLRIGTDDSAQMLPQFYKSQDGKPAFAVDSFYDVMSGKIPMTKYAGKIVIIGPTAAGVGTLFPTPAGSDLSPAEIMAHITSSILSEHFIVQPSWGWLVKIAAIILVAAYLIAGLPRLSAGKAALVTLS